MGANESKDIMVIYIRWNFISVFWLWAIRHEKLTLVDQSNVTDFSQGVIDRGQQLTRLGNCKDCHSREIGGVLVARDGRLQSPQNSAHCVVLELVGLTLFQEFALVLV